ncbi:MAG: NTP transferase domain-containing protein [Bacteroidetes bacterium]|nr:NTP transferase domain-containing protein [Bacteroidota bacterium]
MKTSLPDTIILAGGLGTRLQSIVKDVPKPMALIAGKPFLYWLLKYLSAFYPSKIILSTGYLNHTVKNYFKNTFDNIKIAYSNEDEPLGTGGAIKKALNYCNTENCLILNGDTMFTIDYNSFLNFHIENKNDFTMVLKKIENSGRYGTVKLNGHKIEAFAEKTENAKSGLINAGIYLLGKALINKLPNEEKFSFEKDFLEKKVNDIKLSGWVSDGYFIDIGIPEDYNKANNEFQKLFG